MKDWNDTINPFRKGDKVVLNEAGYEQFPKKAGLVGTVVSEPRGPNLVSVRWGQRKGVSSWSVGLLEPLSRQAELEPAAPPRREGEE